MSARRVRRRLGAVLLLALSAAPLGGCIVAPGGGWCYYHPYRCR